MIDDAPHHIEAFTAHTDAKVIIFSRPWNRNLPTSDRVFRVDSWDQIPSLVASFSQKKNKTPFRELLESLNEID